jgi:hypothetical protein
MSESNIQSLEQSRVQSLYVERVYNLGNYENIKVGVRVEIGGDDDPGLVLASLERIFNDLRADCGVELHVLNRAQRIAATPESELDESDLKRLEQSREIMRKFGEAKMRRRRARQALASLNYTAQYKDHKEEWDDDENDFDVEV